MKLDASRTAAIAVALAAVTFVCVNIVSGAWFSAARVDVTEGGVYTTSDEIASVFEGIEEPIVVRLYFSPALGAASPRHAAYAQRVRDLLEQYAKLAPGKLKVEYYNPEPFSDTEDRAVGFGLQAIPLGGVGEVGYFGLAATNSTDDQEVIPFFNLEREQFLEYDLAKLIYSLSQPEQPKIGLITSLPLDGGMQPDMFGGGQGRQTPPWAIMQQIREFFAVETLDASLSEIPEDISILLLAQPDSLTEEAQYAIDQFVLKGGKALVFVDPNAEGAGPMGGFGGGSLDGIKKLMQAWGVTMADNVVVGDMANATRVNAESGGRPVVSDYVAWLQLGPDSFDPNDAITGNLGAVNLGTAGALDAVEGASTTVEPLIVSSAQSMRIDSEKTVGLPDVVALFRDFVPSGKAEMLAARITGPAQSAFPGGPPPAGGSEAGDGAARPEHVAESTQPIQVVVVSDTDILEDRFWVQQSNFFGQQVLIPNADNASFVTNALENLTGSPALSSLRGRGSQNRPFDLIENIRRDAEQQYRATEQALQNRLEELQKQVNDIQLGAEGAVLSDENRRAIENFRGEILDTRAKLREVQRALRQDIETLEGAIKFINIAGVPIIFGILMIVAASLRARRRRVKAAEA